MTRKQVWSLSNLVNVDGEHQRVQCADAAGVQTKSAWTLVHQTLVHSDLLLHHHRYLKALNADLDRWGVYNFFLHKWQN